MPSSMNELKSHMLLTCKNVMISDFTGKKFLLQEMVAGRVALEQCVKYIQS